MCAFHSLEVARQALFVQQSALHTTSHNIANANTEGYSRQRVNFEQQTAYPFGSRNRPQIPGQIGTGVKAGSVDRIRVDYLDVQYRTENSQSGYWQTRANALGRIESLMNEPSDTGLASVLNDFWASLQDLSVNPDNSGARSVVIQRGGAVADTFNYLAETISGFQNDIKQQMEQKALQVNNIIKQIHDINGQVSRLEPHGYTTNDLYDKRDLLIDELSSILNIEVTKSASGKSELTPASADGVVTIKLKDSDGNSRDITLVNGQGEPPFNEFEVDFDEAGNFTGFQVGGELVTEINDLGNGSMKAMYELYTQTFPEVLSQLDEMAYYFATEFNKIHQQGDTLDGKEGTPFFGGFEAENNAALNIKVIIEDPSDIAAAQRGQGVGDGTNIQELIKMFDQSLKITVEDEDGNEAQETIPSIMENYQSLIGKLAVETQQANQMTDSTGMLQAQVDRQRQSVSAVSLDEEMTNLIQFQHAYNAAARNITAIDEMLDRIINNMGLVGR